MTGSLWFFLFWFFTPDVLTLVSVLVSVLVVLVVCVIGLGIKAPVVDMALAVLWEGGNVRGTSPAMVHFYMHVPPSRRIFTTSAAAPQNSSFGSG